MQLCAYVLGKTTASVSLSLSLFGFYAVLQLLFSFRYYFFFFVVIFITRTVIIILYRAGPSSVVVFAAKHARIRIHGRNVKIINSSPRCRYNMPERLRRRRETRSKPVGRTVGRRTGSGARRVYIIICLMHNNNYYDRVSARNVVSGLSQSRAHQRERERPV